MGETTFFVRAALNLETERQTVCGHFDFSLIILIYLDYNKIKLRGSLKLKLFYC
jgi:hypothetical protein